MNLNDIYTLEDRGLIFINGVDAKKFLQNIVSNDIEKITDKSTIFSSLLTPQGKYLFDFIIIKHKNGFFLDCEKSQVFDLFKILNIYKLRSKVEILDLSNEFVVAVLSRDKFLSLKNTQDIEGNTVKFREDTLFLDPRNKKLGARLVINLEKLYLSIKKLNLKPAEPKKYYSLSHKLGIPQIECKNLKDKIKITGNPVRQDLLNLTPKTAAAKDFFKLIPDRKTLLVSGARSVKIARAD